MLLCSCFPLYSVNTSMFLLLLASMAVTSTHNTHPGRHILSSPQPNSEVVIFNIIFSDKFLKVNGLAPKMCVTIEPNINAGMLQKFILGH